MTRRHIVVGIDGSPSSQGALRWALAEARLRGAKIEAVHVWRYPALAYAGIWAAAPVYAHDEFEAGARVLLDSEVDTALADEHDAPVVERVILEGAAAHGLLQRAEKADLLVVGHRGRGGFVDLLLGSVAHQCSAHATCPVVIVRDAGGNPNDR